MFADISVNEINALFEREEEVVAEARVEDTKPAKVVPPMQQAAELLKTVDHNDFYGKSFHELSEASKMAIAKTITLKDIIDVVSERAGDKVEDKREMSQPEKEVITGFLGGLTCSTATAVIAVVAQMIHETATFSEAREKVANYLASDLKEDDKGGRDQIQALINAVDMMVDAVHDKLQPDDDGLEVSTTVEPGTPFISETVPMFPAEPAPDGQLKETTGATEPVETLPATAPETQPGTAAPEKVIQAAAEEVGAIAEAMKRASGKKK